MTEYTENTALTADEAAMYLSISPKTLADMRSAGKSPKYYKPTHKLVYYYKKDLDEWIKRNENK